MGTIPALSDAMVMMIAAALVGWAAAWCGRKVGLPGFVLPVVAGVLMGPGVFPEVHEYLFEGSGTEQRELVEREVYFEGQVESLRATGVTEDAVVEYRQRVEGELEAYRMGVIDARARRDAGRRVVLWSAVGLTLVGLGAQMRVGRLLGKMRAGMAGAMGMILVTAVLGAVGATVLGRMRPGAEANLWFAGLMLCGMSAAIPVCGRLTDRRELVEAAGLLVMVVVWVVFALVRPGSVEAVSGAVMETHVGDAMSAGVLIVAAMFAVRAGKSVLLGVVVLGIAGVGYFVLGLHAAMLAWGVGLAVGGARGGEEERNVSRRVVGVAGPVAMVMIGWEINVVRDFGLWLLVAAVIVFGDGKGLGMLLGGRSLRMGVAAGAGGMLPVVVAFVLYEARVIDGALLGVMVMANVICAVMARWMMGALGWSDRQRRLQP